MSVIDTIPLYQQQSSIANYSPFYPSLTSDYLLPTSYSPITSSNNDSQLNTVYLPYRNSEYVPLNDSESDSGDESGGTIANSNPEIETKLCTCTCRPHFAVCAASLCLIGVLMTVIPLIIVYG